MRGGVGRSSGLSVCLLVALVCLLFACQFNTPIVCDCHQLSVHACWLCLFSFLFLFFVFFLFLFFVFFCFCFFRFRSCLQGVKALYSGLMASNMGIIPYAGVDLAVYGTIKAVSYTHLTLPTIYSV